MSQPFELNIYQKRQATLLYHYTSMDYLRGLKLRIDALIAGADFTLQEAQEQGRDALIINPRWGVRDTAGNWATYAFPALKDFQKSVSWHIASRAKEVYGKGGAYQCAYMLSEYSMRWATEEEEVHFRKLWETVYSYASKIDDSVAHQGGWDDFSFALEWLEVGALFPKLPKFRIRFDIEAETDKRPPRTGVYVPQDDPWGALQFGWTGDNDGALGEAQTLNAFGLQAAQSIGRADLWVNGQAMATFANRPENKKFLKDDSLVEFPVIPELAPSAIARSSFTYRPCKWYYVEMLHGEWELEEPGTDVATTKPDDRQRGLPGQIVPVSGIWHTPALNGQHGLRFFKQGEYFPDTANTEYGAVIWHYDPTQQS